jgi:hypothetical protein
MISGVAGTWRSGCDPEADERTSPLHFPFVWAALTSALIFGTHHLYQGRQGFLSTAILGIAFTAVLLVTGIFRQPWRQGELAP